MIRLRHLSVLPALFWAVWSVAQPSASVQPDSLAGVWTGTVTAPQGEDAVIGFEFYHDASDVLTFRVSLPVMSLQGAELGLPVKPDAAGGYTIAAPLDIRFRREGDRLTGTFGADQLPLQLSRGGELPRRPETPAVPPAPAPLWQYPLGTGTWAPPITDGTTVYLGATDGRFHAVQASDGTARWVWPGTIPVDGRATFDATAVYFLDTRYNLVALDRHNGSFLWRTPLHNEFLAGHSAPANPTFNHRAATPLLHDGTLYVGSSDGGLYALDPATGSVRWRHQAGAAIHAGVGLSDDDTLLFGTMDGSVALLDRRTRRETLRVRTGGGIVTTPLLAGGLLVVGSRDYSLHAFQLPGGTLAWKYSCWFSWIESTPVPYGGLLYFGSSDYARVTALDPASGRARWSAPVHGLSWGSPLVTERHVFAGTVNQKLPGTLITHQAGLIKLDRATGTVVWRLRLPPAAPGHFAGYAGGPVLAGDKVIVAGLDGFLTAFPAD